MSRRTNEIYIIQRRYLYIIYFYCVLVKQELRGSYVVGLAAFPGDRSVYSLYTAMIYIIICRVRCGTRAIAPGTSETHVMNTAVVIIQCKRVVAAV